MLAHSVAKAGVTRMSKVLAIEPEPLGVRIDSLLPVIVQTEPLLRDDGFVIREGFRNRLLVRRIREPVDIVNAVPLTVSHDKSYIPGATLTIDGGQEASELASHVRSYWTRSGRYPAVGFVTVRSCRILVARYSIDFVLTDRYQTVVLGGIPVAVRIRSISVRTSDAIWFGTTHVA